MFDQVLRKWRALARNYNPWQEQSLLIFSMEKGKISRRRRLPVVDVPLILILMSFIHDKLHNILIQKGANLLKESLLFVFKVLEAV